MNLRFRLFIIGIGALLVVLTYTFPLWITFFQSEGEIFPFPELAEELREDFDALPPSARSAYLTLREEDARLAVQMASTALQDPVIVPLDEQENPNFQGQQAVRSGTFVEIDAIRRAEGQATIYELPDGNRYLWLEDFNAVNGPGLRLFLSTRTPAMMNELEEDEVLDLSLDDVLLDPLRATVGNQAYDVPSEIDLSLYESVVIYSTDLDLIYSMAVLN